MARMPIPDDWDGTSYCCRIVQWPASSQWSAILLGLITWPLRGRFWDERTGQVTDAQAIGQEIYSKNVLDGGCIVTCIDDLEASLDAIAAAIGNLATAPAQTGCCAYSPVAVGGAADPGSQVGDEGVPSPPGYGEATPEISSKCLIANWYLLQCVSVITQLSDVGAIGLLIIGVAFGITVILAGLELGLSALALAVIFGEFGAFGGLVDALLASTSTNLDNVLQAMDTYSEEFICALVTAINSGQARENIADWADNAGLNAVEKALAATLMTDYSLACLFFERDGVLNEALMIESPYDCAGCEGGCPFVVSYGDGTITYGGEEFVLSAEDLGGGVYYLEIQSPCNSGGCDEAGNWCVEITASTIDTENLTVTRIVSGWNTSCALNARDYQGSSPSFPPFDQALATSVWEFTDLNPFTVTAKINGRFRALSPGELPDAATACPEA